MTTAAMREAPSGATPEASCENSFQVGKFRVSDDIAALLERVETALNRPMVEPETRREWDIYVDATVEAGAHGYGQGYSRGYMQGIRDTLDQERRAWCIFAATRPTWGAAPGPDSPEFRAWMRGRR